MALTGSSVPSGLSAQEPHAERGRPPASLAVTSVVIVIILGVTLAAAFTLWRTGTVASDLPISLSDSAVMNHKRALRLAAEGDLKGAEESLLTAVALDPGYAPAHFALADLYDESGKPALAAEKLKSLLVSNPNAAHVKCRQAELYLKADGFEKVIESCRAELKRDPGCSLANTTMGMALTLAGRKKEAVSHLRAAHAASPRDERITRTLAQLMGQNGQVEEAIKLAQGMVRGDDTAPEVDFLMGWLLGQRPATDAASQKLSLEHLTHAAATPDMAAASGALGQRLARLGQTDAARPLLERAYKSGSFDLESLRAYAEVCARLKRPEAQSLALETRQKASFDARMRAARAAWLERPDDDTNTLALAELERSRGDLPDARDLVVGVLKKDPNDSRALRLLETILNRR